MSVTAGLEGDLVRLRPREASDLGLLNHRFGDPAVLAGIGSVTFPQSIEGIRTWYRRSRADATQIAFSVEPKEREQPIGVCALERIAERQRSAVLGIWIGERFWNRGYGTQATRLICRFGFRQMNLHRIGLTVVAGNAKAIRAYEKVGFRREALLEDAHFAGGTHVDLVSMSLLANDPATSSAAP